MKFNVCFIFINYIIFLYAIFKVNLFIYVNKIIYAKNEYNSAKHYFSYIAIISMIFKISNEKNYIVKNILK